ncbi:MAG: ribosomal protein S18-alanine N-acetyltransferase [Bacilli bacterium]|nr:ribosomal protein S18-alanine N-acetyltransferase [Bacilli bacterium]
MFKIRNIERNDIKRLVELEEELLKETVGEEMLAAELHNKFAYFYVATFNDEVIGYLSCWMVEDTVDIINVVIDKNYQHYGYGQALFAKMEEDAKRNNCNNVMLEVKENNIQAINFYLKQGYVQISIRKNYYQDLTNALIMKKVIE